MSAADGPRPFPFHAADPLEPPAEYAILRREDPVSRIRLPSGDQAWLVTRYEHVRQILADKRCSRAATARPGAPRLMPVTSGSRSMFLMDPPEHTRLRRLISGAFAPKRVETLLPRIRLLTTELLDAMESSGPPADLMSHLAEPLPMTVICELLGVPYTDVGLFRAWTDIMLSFDASRRDEILAARDHLDDYLATLIAAKRRRPAADLLTELIQARDEGDRLSEEELLGFGHTLLIAGYHTTTAHIAHATIRLLRTPDLFARIGADPGLLTKVVTEILRCSQAGSGIGMLRVATEDVEVGGTTIRAGEAVLPMINAANRDPEALADPDRIAPERPGNLSLTFGHGIHYCLGAQLGRIELETALGSLIRRFPGLRLATGEDELLWGNGLAFKRPTTLPVCW